MTNEPIDVVIVDDHPLVRRGVRDVLTEPGVPLIRLLGEAATAEAALELVEQYLPDVLISDLRLGNTFEPGLDLIRQVRRISPQTRVLVLTGFDDGDRLLQALAAGAGGCISKADELSSAELRRAVAEIAQGDHFSSPLAMQRLHERLQQPGLPPIAALTNREREVVRLIAGGASNQEIANQLVVTVKTVKTHVSNILEKLQLKSRYEVAYLYRAQAGS